MNLALRQPIHLYGISYRTRDRVEHRKALGAVPHQPHWPDWPCEFCWPALITATLYDTGGHACCLSCANNPNRVARLPRPRH